MSLDPWFSTNNIFRIILWCLKYIYLLEIKIVNFDMTISVLYEYYIFCGMTYHYSSTCWHQKPICHFFQVCSRMSGIRRSNTLILSMQLLFMMNIYTKRKSIYNKNIQKGDLYDYPFHSSLSTLNTLCTMTTLVLQTFHPVHLHILYNKYCTKSRFKFFF